MWLCPGWQILSILAKKNMWNFVYLSKNSMGNFVLHSFGQGNNSNLSMILLSIFNITGQKRFRTTTAPQEGRINPPRLLGWNGPGQNNRFEKKKIKKQVPLLYLVTYTEYRTKSHMDIICTNFKADKRLLWKAARTPVFALIVFIGIWNLFHALFKTGTFYVLWSFSIVCWQFWLDSCTLIQAFNFTGQ